MSLHPHWRPEELELVKTLSSYSGMIDLAMVLAKRLPSPAVQVCGPLSTGGRGSFEANLVVFNQAIQWLSTTQGKIVFDQRPFETPMRRIVEAKKISGYPQELLDEFYLPLFESGHIKELYFLPDWESSIGATWEYQQAKRLKITIFHLPPGF